MTIDAHSLEMVLRRLARRHPGQRHLLLDFAGEISSLAAIPSRPTDAGVDWKAQAKASSPGVPSRESEVGVTCIPVTQPIDEAWQKRSVELAHRLLQSEQNGVPAECERVRRDIKQWSEARPVLRDELLSRDHGGY